MKKGISLLLLLCLAGCSQKHIKQKSKRTFSNINHTLQDTYHTAIAWDQPLLENTDQPLSLEQAINFAMHNNVQLQADLEKLGIANADLMQAQLFSNPQLVAAFRIPKKRSVLIGEETANLKADIEIDFFWQLSDLWQVPLRKRVAEDELEIVSLRVLQKILDVYTETKITYARIIYWQALCTNAQAALQQAQELNKQIKYRFNFGYNTEQEIQLANAQVKMLEINVIEAENQLTDYYARLRELLHLPVNSNPVHIVNDISIPAQLPPQKQVEQFMFTNRPEVHIAQTNIQQAQHKIKLERANVFDNVQFGLAYERDPSGLDTRGPFFGINFPLFDLNQAQISRAKTILIQREKELISTKNILLTELILIYQQVQTDLQKIPAFQQLLSSYQEAINFDLTYAKGMQLNWLQAMQNQLAYYEQRKQFIMLLMNTSKNLAQLERAIGASLNIKFNLKKLPVDRLI